MATAMERKFTGLRKRLDQLGYRQALGVESLPLVERIFNDLLHTTESLRNAKLQLAKNKEQKGMRHFSLIHPSGLFRLMGKTHRAVSARQQPVDARKHQLTPANNENERIQRN
jgi:hypothetical protein